MYYDPIKDRLGAWFSRRPVLQRLFYGLLHLFFLRSWHVRRELKRLLGSLPPETPIDVLDAGTGFGQYADHVARHYPQARIHAVDVKADYLENARRYFDKTPCKERVTLALDDLTQLEATGPYDLILSVDVMEHIEADEAVFRHFARVLKPGGHVVVNTPSDQGGSDVSGEGETSFIEEHVRDGYNREALAAKLEAAGLKVVRSRYTYGPYGSLAWRLMIKGPILALGKSIWLAILLPLYYVPILPIGLLLHTVDLYRDNETGTGLQVTARRP